MPHTVRIRPARRTDIPALVSLLRPLLRQDDMVTTAGLLHYRATLPRRARSRWWVALSGRTVVGWVLAELQKDTSTPGVGMIWVGVAPRHRRRGIGGRLYTAGAKHLRTAGARELRSWMRSDSRAGRRFLAARGFRPARSARVWLLDPRSADVRELPQHEASVRAAGFRVAPLRDLMHRPHDLHQLFAAIELDVPGDHPRDRSPYAEWCRTELDHPNLDLDGSVVVLAGDAPVALAWLHTDPEGRRASSHLTGTLSEYRRRGLAHLAKLHTIRWAAASGITTMFTSNDRANAGMLALNRQLGYRPMPGYTTFVRPRRRARVN